MKSIRLSAALGGAIAATAVALTAMSAGADDQLNPAMYGGLPVLGVSLNDYTVDMGAPVQRMPAVLASGHGRPALGAHFWGTNVSFEGAPLRTTPVVFARNHGRPTLGQFDLDVQWMGAPGRPTPVVFARNHGQPTLGTTKIAPYFYYGAPVRPTPVVIVPNYGYRTLGIQGEGRFMGASVRQMQPTPAVVMPNHGQPTLGFCWFNCDPYPY
jgi:hypothetical protein